MLCRRRHLLLREMLLLQQSQLAVRQRGHAGRDSGAVAPNQLSSEKWEEPMAPHLQG